MLNRNFGRVFIVFFALFLINLYCQNINVNADSSFPLRYVKSIFSTDPFFIFVQPGNRFFPEILYSSIAYLFTDKLIPWSRIVIAINTVILAHSIYFLCRNFNLNKNRSIAILVAILLTIPLFTYIHDNVLVYFVFSPGIHGFLIPYILYAISLSYILNYKSFNKIQIVIYVIVVALCSFSDSTFVLASIVPVLIVFLISMMANFGPSRDRLILWFVFSLLGLGIAYMLINLLPAIVSNQFKFLDVNYSVFGDNLMDWFHQNNFFRQLTDRTISGYLFEFILVTLVTSVILIFRRILFLKASTQVFYINFIYLLWLPVFIYAMWAVGKSNLRLVPFIILFTPILLAVNILKLSNLKINYDSLSQISVVLVFIGAIGLLNNKHISLPYYQHDVVFTYLQKLKQKQIINSYGLSGYWIANIDDSSEFEVSPLNSNGHPSIYATNALKSWNWDGVKPQEKKFTFIINKCSSECFFSEDVLIRLYGKYDKINIISQNKKIYKVYIYSNGLESNILYTKLKKQIYKHSEVVFDKYFEI